jgi:hypothetical protein
VNHTNLTLNHKILTRGSVLDALDLCGAYFQCATGYYYGYYYLASITTTAMGCLPCLWPEKTQSEWVAVSHGLTFGDAYSCLAFARRSQWCCGSEPECCLRVDL